ncbi:hypothetical protein FB45DRAFT_1112005 [Roridomyces roridus]|uniref:Uncharacterized protein n=1 Tax=Roridomyces roridus TaxID=1738132 RepID=A0AAD7B8S6_9AGAR|nr:hypothetical protein FB45DRAFT_1112005 [Roridomyces roridus]
MTHSVRASRSRQPGICRHSEWVWARGERSVWRERCDERVGGSAGEWWSVLSGGLGGIVGVGECSVRVCERAMWTLRCQEGEHKAASGRGRDMGKDAYWREGEPMRESARGGGASDEQGEEGGEIHVGSVAQSESGALMYIPQCRSAAGGYINNLAWCRAKGQYCIFGLHGVVGAPKKIKPGQSGRCSERGRVARSAGSGVTSEWWSVLSCQKEVSWAWVSAACGCVSDVEVDVCCNAILRRAWAECLVGRKWSTKRRGRGRNMMRGRLWERGRANARVYEGGGAGDEQGEEGGEPGKYSPVPRFLETNTRTRTSSTATATREYEHLYLRVKGFGHSPRKSRQAG